MSVSQSKLGDQAIIVMGQSPPGNSYNQDGKGAPLLNGPTEFGSVHPTEKQWTTSPTKFCRAGDVLFCVRGATAGRLNLADKEYCIGRGLAAIRGKTGSFDSGFLRYVLANGYSTFQSRGVGSTFINISGEELSSFPVPALPLAEQRRIAEVLDRAEALRAKRRAALAQLDSLTQSLFLDLFGDPSTNPKGLRKAPLGELIKLKSGDFLPATAMANAGLFPVFGGNGINGYHDQYMFDDPRIIVGRVGVYCGCVHVSPPKSWVTDNALYINERKKTVEFGYLVHALMRANLNQYASQSGQPLVSGSRIYPVEILVPPIELQRAFARRVEAVETLKAAQRTSLAELDALFAALQHRAFNGELFRERDDASLYARERGMQL